jgi:four helix bundle protein
MKYERFEDLPVWQAAADVAAKLFGWTAQAWFRGKGDLTNQLQRSALSISNNIAEGFERGTTSELLQFLYIARGSAGEVRSMLGVMERILVVEAEAVISDLKSQRSDLSHFKSQISNFKSECEGISRQIRGWANSLQNSNIEGQRHLNDQTKQAFEQRQRRDAFQKKLDAANEDARRKREAERLDCANTFAENRDEKREI